MFGTRLLSGAILLAVTIVTVSAGGTPLLVAVAAISLIGLYELYRVLGFHGSLLGAIGYAGSIFLDGLVWAGREELLLPLLVGMLMVFLTVYVLSYPKYRADQVSMAFFGLFYVTNMLSYVCRVRGMEDGLLIVWLIFIAAWGSDTCAYCVGKLLGRHKFRGHMAALSPNKSVEGCVGGIAGAALIGALYGYLARGHLLQIGEPVLAFALMGAAGSLIAQVGDLAASAIKRNYGVKDYGTLIPGHGGVLDRFDSILFTAPIVYALAVIF